ncbi:MAG: ElyC/SanA/YdcF family protein [Herbinix sp.]|nr:ElyC/SanA/YdcF family protein [Herbinix sp.]
MRQKTKSRIKQILLLLICLGILGVIILLSMNSHIKASVKNQIITSEDARMLNDVDCILVLGAGIWENNEPSPMLEDRIKLGIELYKAGVSECLLMSGDHGRIDYDEVNVMKQYAIDAGVPSEDIFMDHAGFSTYESLYRARDIFEVDKMIIVTQKYHMYRAIYVGKGLGLDVYGVTSDPRQYAGQNKREAREILARVKDFFYVVAKPKPTYLGETIPVSGNGDITNDKKYE